ncbi:MAG: flagellar assembly protein FliH [Rhodoferax sp.]|jgi:flagellar assembly protein FliH|nr:flagellar assembly protein FliH [Rhodoferax sp.]
MRNISRFIPGEEIDAVSQWNFGAVDTDARLLAAKAQDEQDALRRARDEVVRQEAFAEGFAQGRARAMADADQRVRVYAQSQGEEAAQRFARLIESAEEQLGASQQTLAQGVLELACALARQVLRQELSVNPNVLQPVIREALSVLSVDNKSAIVRLNPVDMEVLQEALQTEFSGMALALVADTAVKPGGCVIVSSGTVVDGTLDTRWRRAVANLGLATPWDA